MYPPWFGGTRVMASGRRSPTMAPGTRNRARARERVGVRHRRTDRAFEDQVTWTPVNFNLSYTPGDTSYDFDIGQDVVHAAAGPVGRLQRWVLRRESGADGEQRDADHAGDEDRRPPRTSWGHRSGPPASSSSTTSSSRREPAVFDTRHHACRTSTTGRSTAVVVLRPVRTCYRHAKNGVIVGQFPNQGEYFGARSARGTHSSRAWTWRSRP